MQFHHDDLYQDRTWFDELGAWFMRRAQQWRPRQLARLWTVGFALFASLCVAWAAALATQCVLVDLPGNVCLAQWLAAGLLLVAARHFLKATGLSAASAIEPDQRLRGHMRAQAEAFSVCGAEVPHGMVAQAGAAAPAAAVAKAPPLDEDPQLFFRTVKAAGINVRIAHALYAAGFRTAEQVRAAEDTALLAAPGIGPATLRKLRAQFGAADDHSKAA